MRLIPELWLLPTGCPGPCSWSALADGRPEASFLRQRRTQAVIMGTNATLWGSPGTQLQVVSREGVWSPEVFGLPRLVHLCLQGRNGAGSGASSGARNPVLHPFFVGRGLSKAMELWEPSPNPEGSQEVTLPRDWRTWRENGHHLCHMLPLPKGGAWLRVWGREARRVPQGG